MNLSPKSIAKYSPFGIGIFYALKRTQFELTKDEKF
jgi:hypothetical protein